MNHTMIRLCAALLLLGLGLFWHKPAHAAGVSCTASMTSVNFGTVDPQSSQTPASATLDYDCFNPPGNGTVYATICFSIGDGAQGAGNADPRQMLDTDNDVLEFQLYQDSAHSIVWGSSFFGINTPYVVHARIKNNHHATDTVTLYGLVLPNQFTAIPNPSYQDAFTGGHTAIAVNQNNSLPYPQCSTSIQSSFPFTVTAAVQNKCTVTAATLDFGTPVGLLTAAIQGTSTVTVTCASGTAYNVGLDGGQNSGNDINARKMVLGVNSVGYQLYRDSGRTQVWGNTIGTNTVAGLGNGSAQNLTVYGQVPAQPTPPAGTYQDTVVVSVTY
jgi:spore coat protein U-like protein